jgi:hypothetical protein
MKRLRCFLFGLLTTSLVAAHAVSLTLSSYLGGNGSDAVSDVAAFGSDLYVTGLTTSSDFPGGEGPVTDFGVFVSRIDLDGRGVLFTTILDGEAFDSGISIAGDDLGAAYVTGETHSRDFPVFHAFQPDLHICPLLSCFSQDAFVTKLPPAPPTLGFSLAWRATYPWAAIGMVTEWTPSASSAHRPASSSSATPTTRGTLT